MALKKCYDQNHSDRSGSYGSGSNDFWKEFMTFLPLEQITGREIARSSIDFLNENFFRKHAWSRVHWCLQHVFRPFWCSGTSLWTLSTCNVCALPWPLPQSSCQQDLFLARSEMSVMFLTNFGIAASSSLTVQSIVVYWKQLYPKVWLMKGSENHY